LTVRCASLYGNLCDVLYLKEAQAVRAVSLARRPERK
jgi:hypothetical protein